jgi:hypothetical protein
MASLFTIQAKPADGDPTVNPADGCPLDRDPSLFVRASMSVPGFFRPCTANINDKGDWAGLAYYKGQLPADKTAVFVDGGTLSNFPLELFDVGDYVPLMPTLGCQLGVQRDDENHVALDVSNPLKLYKAMNETSRHIGDWEYIREWGGRALTAGWGPQQHADASWTAVQGSAHSGREHRPYWAQLISAAARSAHACKPLGPLTPPHTPPPLAPTDKNPAYEPLLAVSGSRAHGTPARFEARAARMNHGRTNKQRTRKPAAARADGQHNGLFLAGL